MIHFLLCGGSGTRLWPVSRKNFPKQFCRLLDDKSLFQDTVLRNSRLCDRQLVIVNKDSVFMSMSQIDELADVSTDANYILEPVGRNTAPAIAIGCFAVDPDEIVLITPTDHLIKDVEKYRETLIAAKKAAEDGALVTFGIHPDYPETGYGYIETEPVVADALDVISFKEKPEYAVAEMYLQENRKCLSARLPDKYLWNSGMFCFKAGVFLEELKMHSPMIYDKSEQAYKKSVCEDGVCNISYEDMMAIPKDSIDYAVMEKSSIVKVIPSAFGWNDVGSYDALDQELKKDESGNSVSDKFISVDSENNLILSNKVVAAVGVEDLIVVDTPDALLVAKKGSSQKVKEVVSALEKRGEPLAKLLDDHVTVERPWGSFTIIDEHKGFKVKRIEVKPGKRLSLQKHRHRCEHWTVVKGSGIVTKGGDEILLNVDESVYIRNEEIHRIENRGTESLVFIEVQIGDYLGEDDIIRLEDDFKRV